MFSKFHVRLKLLDYILSKSTKKKNSLQLLRYTQKNLTDESS